MWKPCSGEECGVREGCCGIVLSWLEDESGRMVALGRVASGEGGKRERRRRSLPHRGSEPCARERGEMMWKTHLGEGQQGGGT